MKIAIISFYTVFLMLVILGRECSSAGIYAEVENCFLSSNKGYDQVLKLEMEHYYDNNYHCHSSGGIHGGSRIDRCHYNRQYGQHDRNKICLDRDLYLLTNTDCDGIKDENNFISTCDDWNCNTSKCCFTIYYSITYNTQITLHIPGFSFLSKTTTSFTSDTKAKYSGQNNWYGTNCDALNGPIISSITGVSYSVADDTVYAITTVTIEFELDVDVPSTAYYEFTFPYASQLSTFTDSCDLNRGSGTCSHSDQTITFASSGEIVMGTHRFRFYNVRNPESNYSYTVDIRLTSSINDKQFPLTANISRTFNPITDVNSTHLGVEENQPENMGDYIFTFNFSPLPLRQDRILELIFPSEFDLTGFTLMGTSFTLDNRSGQHIYLKLLDTIFMQGDIELRNIKNPSVDISNYVYQLQMATYIEYSGSKYCSHRSTSDDTLKFHLRGSFNSTSSIKVTGDVELEKNSVYEFILHPSPNFIFGTEIQLDFPPELELGSSCSANILHSSCSTHTSTKNIIKIQNALGAGASMTAIQFLAEFIRNPVLPWLVTDLSVNVRTKEPNEWWYHETDIIITFPIYYDPHPIDGLSVSASEYTVTNTTYTFNLRNLDYMIPPHAEIRVKFPPTLLFITSTPTVDNLHNLSVGTTGIFDYPNLTISGGFDVMLAPNSSMQFQVGSILNPYYMGNTNSFQMIIYTSSDPFLKLFEMKIDLNKSITEVAQFPSFNVETASNMTNTWTNFTFDFEVGDGELNSSHLIKFQTADDIQLCDKSTIIPSLGIVTIGNTFYNGSYYTTRTNYSFEITSVINPHTICQFIVECRNPYTTRASGIFSLWATDGTNEFYNQTTTIPNLTDMNDFYRYNFSMTNVHPREIITYSFNFTATSNLSTTRIDQIELTAPDEVEIEGCMPSDLNGIHGTLNCSIVGQIITIYDITKLDPIFSFNLPQLRNPWRSEHEIFFKTITKHSDGYWGENMTSNIVQILCNFPCKTCAYNAPNTCSTCFSSNNEVFRLSGVNEYIWYIDARTCIPLKPTYTYMNTAISCQNCEPSCATCYNRTYQDCYTCIPGLLMIRDKDECWESCFPNSFYNDTGQFCQNCDFRCNNCDGPTHKDCESCSNRDKVVEDSVDKSCNCKVGTSPIYYSHLNTYYCAECHMNCGTCTGSFSYMCVTCKDQIMIYNEMNHTCVCPNQFYSFNGFCMPCDECCFNCDGPLNSDCILGQCNRENSCYPMEVEPTRCVKSCNSDRFPLYYSPASDNCKSCHSDCLSCSGPQANECFSCVPPILLTNKKECLHTDCNLFPETITMATECAECSEICARCVDLPTKCIGCKSPQLFLPETNSCFLKCPPYNYAIPSTRFCNKCEPHCEICVLKGESDSNCIYCAINYFLNKTKYCVRSVNCEENTYANIELRKCLTCNEACIGCTGTGNTRCIQCSKKYKMAENGVCEKITCSSNEYINEDSKCIKCNSRCMGCTGPTDLECKRCIPGLVMNPSSDNKCETCSEYKDGYKNPLSGSGSYECLEVCGDNKNMGILECDDGNLLDGDGCSAFCTVEKGFKCKGGSMTAPDICLETVPPYMSSFSQFDQKILHIEFIEPVQFKDQNPSNAIQFLITGPALIYPFEIANITVDTYTPIIKLNFEINFLASLYGSEKITTSISNTELITDIAGNNILNNSLSIELKPFDYISEDDKKAAEQSATTTQATIITTLVTALLMCLIFNTPLEGLWGLINVLQLISYTILIPLLFPKNLLMFLEGIALVHGFNKYVPNLFKYLFFGGDTKEEPYNQTFKERGFNNRTMILLVGSEITSLVFIIGIIGILTLLKRKCKYSLLIRSIITSYLKIAIASFINFAVVSYMSYNSAFALTFCMFFVGFVVFCPAYLSEFLFQHFDDAQDSTGFRDKFNSLIKEFDIEKGISKLHFYPIFLLRRSIFGAILVFLQDSPYTQLIMINILTFIIIIWMLKTVPFRDKLICASHIVSEIGFLLYGCSLFLLLSEELESESRSFIGSIIVWGLVILMGVIWVMFVCHLVKICIQKRKANKAKKLLLEEQKETQERTQLENDEMILREKRERIKERLAKTRNRKPVIVDMSIRSIPMVGDTLPHNPKPKLIPRKEGITSFHKQSIKTKEQERDELIASIAPKIGSKITQKDVAANARKLRDFHARWRAKRAEQTLQEALFDVYVKQNK